jgi:hypothetical protein
MADRTPQRTPREHQIIQPVDDSLRIMADASKPVRCGGRERGPHKDLDFPPASSIFA